MSKSNDFKADVLKYVFQNTDALSGITTFYVSLHTASPGSAGNQTTNEASYAGYSRVSVNRNSTDWSVVDQTASLNLTILFPNAMNGPEIITYVGVGTDASGSGKLLYYGVLTTPLTVNNGIVPKITNFQIMEG